jgi:arginase
MDIHIIQVPYDSGHRNLRMGAGPANFIKEGAVAVLRSCGYSVKLDCIEASRSFPTEIKIAFELCRLIAERVRKTCAEGNFPLVLSGNCNSSLGTLAGLDPSGLGMIWLDAHGDFNTPETSESGFFDGMGMSIATGHCWKKIAATIPGFRPVSDSNVVHVGGRDFDPQESELLGRSGVQVITAELIRKTGLQEAVGQALDTLRMRVDKVYLHIDLDVLDPEQTPANEYSSRVPNGLTTEEVEEAIQLIGVRFRICAGGIASYDPAYDKGGQTFHAGMKLIKGLLAQAT